MLVNRKMMIDHLGKLHANGQVKEAVLQDAFACNALSVDGQLLVLVPPIKGVEPLPEPVGLVDVMLLRKALSSLVGDAEEVAIDFEDGETGTRIMLQQKHGGWMNLITARPALIQSAVKEENVKKVLKVIPTKKAAQVSLSQEVIQGLLESAALINEDAITLKVGNKSSAFVVGNEKTHMAGTEPFGAKTEKGEDPYELLFSAKIIMDVFRQLSDYTSTTITLSGPESVVQIAEGDYKWIVSPQEPA